MWTGEGQALALRFNGRAVFVGWGPVPHHVSLTEEERCGRARDRPSRYGSAAVFVSPAMFHLRKEKSVDGRGTGPRATVQLQFS